MGHRRWKPSRNTAARGCSAPATTSSFQGRFDMTISAGRLAPVAALCVAGAFLSPAVAAAPVWPRPATAQAPDAALEARVKSIVAGMTLEQKIGQMTQPDIRSVKPDEVRQYYIGSILNGGGAWPA